MPRKKKQNSNRPNPKDIVGKTQPPKKGVEIFDEHVVMLGRMFGIIFKDESLIPIGYSCSLCDYVVKKTGPGSLNSIRGHLKKHRNEERVGRVTNRLSILGFIVLAIAIAYSFIRSLGVDPVFELGEFAHRQLSLVHYLSGASIVVTLLHWYASEAAKFEPGRRRLLLYNSTFSIALTTVVVNVWFLIRWKDIEHPELFVIGLLPGLVAGLESKSVGRVKLDKRRRDLKPRDYVRLFRSKTVLIDHKIFLLRVKVREALKEKKLHLNKLSTWQMIALTGLEISVDPMNYRTRPKRIKTIKKRRTE